MQENTTRKGMGLHWFEPKPSNRGSLKQAIKDSTVFTVLAGLIPVFILFLTVGPVLVTSLQDAGLSQPQIIGWMLAIHVFGGINGLVLSVYYRMPIVGAYSIPGIAIAAGALGTLTYPEALAGFIGAGLIVFLIGITGLAKTLVRYIPGPIMFAMIAGVLLSFPLQIISGVQAAPLIGVATILGYIIFHLWVPRVPGIMGALFFGTTAAVVQGEFAFEAVEFGVGVPHFEVPEFSWIAVLSLSLPLAMAVVGSENMQSIGVLKTIGFRPPVTAMTVMSGIGGVVAGFFGGHNANIAGPATAAAAAPDTGPARSRFFVAFLSCLVVMSFGIFAPMVLDVFAFFPEALMSLLVGLVLLPIVASAFTDAWEKRQFPLSVLVTFLIASSGVSMFGISSAFWALLFGCLSAILIERKDLKAYSKEHVSEFDETEPEMDREPAQV